MAESLIIVKNWNPTADGGIELIHLNGHREVFDYAEWSNFCREFRFTLKSLAQLEAERLEERSRHLHCRLTWQQWERRKAEEAAKHGL